MNNIVLPSLLDFVESHLSAIYNAISQDDTTTAVNDFLSKDATIVVNGKNIYPADLINLFQGETASEVAASVNFNASVVVPYDTMNPNTAGSVGIFFVVSMQEKLRVDGGAGTRTMNASLNVSIDQDQSITPPMTVIRGNFDQRRVKYFNLVVTQADPAPAAPVTV